MKPFPSYRYFYLLLLPVCLLVATGCKKEPVSQPQVLTPHANSYEPLRYMALHMKPKDLNLSFPIDETVVYGMVLDENKDNHTTTLVAFQTGEASRYDSNGSAIVGGASAEKVNDAAKLWVDLAQPYLEQSQQTTETPLPEAESVAFYFVTNWGNFVATESLSNLEDKSSYWLPLYTQAKKVETELKKTAATGTNKKIR
ncbi:hypothetical protein [Flavobacterium sp. XGLA_31]|uniref:hypothetical protein n=1 Tax=Flavobacterium sp. XGLA_31 TaxID=3447666 RepID=UPI003F371957